MSGREPRPVSAGEQAGGRRVLVAGTGNVLRQDDGFGVAVIAALQERSDDLPPGTTLIEVGIGGIGLIQELMEGYEALVIVDAVDRDGDPGTLYVLEPEVPDVSALAPEERRIMAADMHALVPSRTLVLAAALDVLPAHVRIIGCQPAETDELDPALTPAVAAAVPAAVESVIRLASELGGSTVHV